MPGRIFQRTDIDRIGESGFIMSQQSSEVSEVSSFQILLSEEGFASVDDRAIEVRRFYEGHT